MRKLARILALAGGVALAAGAAPASALGFGFGFDSPSYCDSYDPYYCPNYGYFGYEPFWGGRQFGGHFEGRGGHFAGHGGHFGGHGGHGGRR